MRAFGAALVIIALSAAPALADGPLATAGGPQAPAPQPQAAAPPLEAAAPDGPGGPPMAMGPCGPEKVKSDGSLETQPHGEVEAGVGTAGYRHLGGAVCQPLKGGGAVNISVSADQWGGRGR